MAIHRMLVTSAVLLLPVTAAANIPFDIKAERVTFSPPVASGTVAEGAVLTIGCEWLALPGPLSGSTLSPALTSKQFTFGGAIRIDGQIVGQISNTLSGSSKLPYKGQSTTVTWKASGTGKRTVSCELSPQEPQMLRNNEPNFVSASITVAMALGPAAKRLGRTLGGDSRTPGTQKSASTATQPAAQAAGPASGLSLPSDKIRGCRTSLTARVDVEPGQLLPPTYGPADMAVTKLTLYLQSSEAAGNSILCRYGSNKKDVSSLVVTVPCLNASPQPTPHSFFCAQ